MTTKFNKDMYAKMRSKKDEPLSNIRKKSVLITGKGSSVTPSASVIPIGTETTRMASPATSVEEIPSPATKRPHLSDREKEKVESRSSTIWDDERLAVDRAHGVATAEDLKIFFGMPVSKVASRHVHKLVQVKCSCNPLPYLFFFFFSFFTDGFKFLFRCWGKVFILPLSILLKRPRWRH